MSGIGIRAATIADADAIARVHVQAWRESYRGLMPDAMLDNLSVDARAARWRRSLEDPAQTMIVRVAERDGDVVGFGSAGRTFSENLAAEAEISTLYLIDEIKRKGVGGRLFRELLTALAERDFASAGLWVLVENVAARRFYEAMGGRSDVTRTDTIGDAPLTDVAYLWDDLGTFAGRSRS